MTLMFLTRAVHCVVLQGNLLGLKQLVNSYANIWMRNQYGNYPLHELLVQLMAGTHRESVDGYLAFHSQLLGRYSYE